MTNTDTKYEIALIEPGALDRSKPSNFELFLLVFFAVQFVITVFSVATLDYHMRNAADVILDVPILVGSLIVTAIFQAVLILLIILQVTGNENTWTLKDRFVKVGQSITKHFNRLIGGIILTSLFMTIIFGPVVYIILFIANYELMLNNWLLFILVVVLLSSQTIVIYKYTYLITPLFVHSFKLYIYLRSFLHDLNIGCGFFILSQLVRYHVTSPVIMITT